MYVCVCDEIFKLKEIEMKILIMYQDAIDVKLGRWSDIQYWKEMCHGPWTTSLKVTCEWAEEKELVKRFFLDIADVLFWVPTRGGWEEF